jgi:hypothetical protein
VNEDKWIGDRSKELAEGDPRLLMEKAVNYGITIHDYSRISSLALLIARKDWEQVEELRGLQQRGVYVNAANEIRLSDVLSEHERATALVDGIVDKFVGAIGGWEWLGGPTTEALRMRGVVEAVRAASRETFGLPYAPPSRPGDGEAGEALAEAAESARTIDFVTLPVDRELIATESAHDIVSTILPRALAFFLTKNADYKDQHRSSKYGLRGELIGLERKMAKLYHAIWLGEAMNGEGVLEMLQDLFGQVMLMLDLASRVDFDEDTMTKWAEDENGEKYTDGEFGTDRAPRF